jgi:hypothetical protein
MDRARGVTVYIGVYSDSSADQSETRSKLKDPNSFTSELSKGSDRELAQQLLEGAKSSPLLQRRCDKVLEETTEATLAPDVWLGILSAVVENPDHIYELAKLLLSRVLGWVSRPSGKIKLFVARPNGEKIEITVTGKLTNRLEYVVDQLARITNITPSKNTDS